MSSFSGLDFVAVDMETANAQRASVCAVGIALVRAGEVVATEKILVQPPTGLDSFSALNRGIHGICAEDVKDAPAWDEVAGQLEVLGSQLPLVVHNAAFDRGAYEAACAEAGRTAQPMEWLDLLELSRRLRPDSRQHTLPVLAEAYGMTLENHHDAEQDARACAEVLVAIAKEQGVQRLGELWPQGGQVGTPTTARRRPSVPTPTSEPAEDDPSRQEWFSRASKTKAADMPKAVAGADPSHPLHGEHVVISGPVQGRDRYKLWERIAEVGGHPQKNVTKKTTVLVAGNRDDLAGLVSGDAAVAVNMTTKERKATEYAAAGQPIRAMTAAAFMEVLGGQEPEDGVSLLGRRTPGVEPTEVQPEEAPSAAALASEAGDAPVPADDRREDDGGRAGRTYGSSAYTPSALRRSRFDDDGPRPWERTEPQQSRTPASYGGGPAPHQWGDAPASQQQGRPNEGVRVAKKIAGVVMMLVALFCVLMTAAGIGQVVEDLGAGDSGDVAIGVGMTAVFALISIWLATKALRWMRG
ncbi:hypothetical protein HMPREF2863_10525 [Micrococcus sp. HMSC067E09]|uniref:exonuclease domain-containing protein n=1 Tax=Micrococcus sp. HMSC067E09 TaxID=1739367 RepID=UPI0008A655BB|nr:exonuclease domain-containing protein [Micrococcus sp. HMSC067E09]OFR88739.1 hypothetical protein HMPREF2863_10525 [Micrococcus sp. HMSC067E09]